MKRIILSLIVVYFGNISANDKTTNGNFLKADPSQCLAVPQNERLDCWPGSDGNQEKCESRGCCWSPPNSVRGLPNIPYCFYQPKAESYKFTNVSELPDGISAFLERSSKSPYPRDVSTIQLIVTYQSDSILRFKIIDPSNPRFESPFPEIDLPQPKTENPLYKFNIENDKQGFKIIRRSDDSVIFDASDLSNFIYSDQFLQITTKLPSTNIYGLGEERKRFRVSTDWKQITFFNHDAAPQDNVNIYGTHPFYLLVENSTNAHGVFLKNSNGLELVLQPTPALTYRAIGGILDFYVFLGPTPSDVLKQYQEVVGKPKMPPYWSLGFHLCRWGIIDLESTKKVLQRNLDAGIPIETQWNDLDYMEDHNDFTYNKSAFGGLPEFVQELHKQGRRYAILIDPGVSGSELPGSYPPYDRGVELDVFVKNSTGQIFIGKVWNSLTTVFPDFTHPNAYTYWKEMLKEFHDLVPFDGAWIDMNEPSNSEWPYGCPDSELENPPYRLNTDGGALHEKTFCMTAKQHLGVHYDIHNLYGISEANITSRALSEILGERSFIISRSTFSGQGRYGGHWGGDVYSTWDELRYSIPHLLDFSLFGMPLMGSDICGFNDNTTEPLCNRWMQLGAFYPFSRNHNSEKLMDQDPAAMGEQVIRSSIKALNIRYSLLPFLYTLFWHASKNGSTVARPLMVEFPDDPNTYDIDTAFLWGSALLIAPVLEDNPSSISVYLPKGRWYNFYDRKPLNSKGEYFEIAVDRETIPLFIRGGSIIPMQTPANTTEEVRKSDIKLLVALDEDGKASGNLYWDDGVSVDVGSDYTVLEFSAEGNKVDVTSSNLGRTPPPKISSIEVIGNGNQNMMADILGIDRYPVKVICGNPTQILYYITH
ncbi:lysosomal alpha-glucosidase-like [Coccinella septempunctata]|uniref:lysosomal alpha-glucosidase-like n=1 Tax=Coccinella septempunctata TaxID=41139 RepID=UPI001D08530B|nr:lysosomal alpha-glucosidase-like [Coccinella septempunctata]